MCLKIVVAMHLRMDIQKEEIQIKYSVIMPAI